MSRPNADFMKNRKRLFKALVKNGCYLFPIKQYRKLPKGMWADISTNDWETIETWISKKWNLGIDTGKSGLLVIDIDTKHQTAEEIQFDLEMLYGDIPPTFTVKTASGGLHYYFKQPAELGNTAGGLLKDVDTRGVGGYVVAPGSVVIDKQVAEGLLVDKTFTPPGKDEPVIYQNFDFETLYKEDIDWLYYTRESKGKIAFAELPEHYANKLHETAESPTKGVACEVDEEDVDTSGAVAGAIDYCLERHPPAIEGENGDNVTFQLFARLRDMGLTEDTVVEIAEEYYNPRCEPPWDYEDLQRIAAHAYTYAKEPLGIMSAHADFKDTDEDAYSDEMLQIVVPETGQVIQPKRNEQRAAKPAEERREEKREEKLTHRKSEAERRADLWTKAFSDEASEIRYVYVTMEDEVYNRKMGKGMSTSAFSKGMRWKYQPLIDALEDKNKPTPFEMAQDLKHLIIAEDFDYIPGAPIFAPSPLDAESVIWNRYKAPDIAAKPGDVSAFMNYLDFLFTNEQDKEVVLNFMAHRVQFPDRIQSYALLMHGNHGSGKTLFAQLLGTMVGEDNYGIVRASDLKSSFNDWAMHRQLILLDECMDIGTREIGNALKTIVGAQELSINRKGKKVIKVRNFADYVVTSNYEDAVPMDFGERRYYVIRTNQNIQHGVPETIAILDPVHAMVRRRNAEAVQNLEAVYAMLMERDLSQYSPDVLPARTEAMENMIRANRYNWQVFLEEAIASNAEGFAFDAYAVSDILQLLKQNNFSKDLKPSAVTGFLETDLGFKVYKQCRSSNFRKDVVVIRNQIAWDAVEDYGIKKALAEYCRDHSSQALEYIEKDDVLGAEAFLKTFTIRNNVTPIKK